MSLVSRLRSFFRARPSTKGGPVPFRDSPPRELVGVRAGEPRPGSVPFLDVASGEVINIPARELRPGCVQATVNGIPGTVWVWPGDLQAGPLRHPPFDDEVRSYVRGIQATFAEHRQLTFEEWEDGFRRDANPMPEIAIWSHAADAYRASTEGEPSADRRAEVFRLLVGCMTADPASVWHVVRYKLLSREEADEVVRRYYGPRFVPSPE